MKNFDSKTTLAISEGYDLEKQHHYVEKSCSFCDCFHKKCTFRLWQVLVFLFSFATIIVLLGFLIAMFGPGSNDLKYHPTNAALREEGRLIRELLSSNLMRWNQADSYQSIKTSSTINYMLQFWHFSSQTRFVMLRIKAILVSKEPRKSKFLCRSPPPNILHFRASDSS